MTFPQVLFQNIVIIHYLTSYKCFMNIVFMILSIKVSKATVRDCILSVIITERFVELSY